MGYLDDKGLAHLWNNLKALMKNDITINQGGNITIPEGLGAGPYTIEFTENDDVDDDFVTIEQLNSGIESANQYTDSSVETAKSYTDSSIESTKSYIDSNVEYVKSYTNSSITQAIQNTWNNSY